MKILIISAFFPPQNSIASLRPYCWAKFWSRAGHDVTVLTVPKRPTPADTVLPFQGFSVVEIPVPGIKQHRAAEDISPQAVAAENGAASSVRGLWRRLHRWINIQQARYGFAYGCRMPDPHDLWALAVFRAARSTHWDLVVSTAGPYSAHAPASALKRRGLARHWIADWRDLWVDNPTFPGLPGFRWLERWLERRWCLAADAVTTVSSPLANSLERKYQRKVHVIHNGFDPEDYLQLPLERTFPEDGVVRIVYTGSIYAGRQDPSALFKSIAAMDQEGVLSPDRLQVLFCGNNANVDAIANRFGVSAYVQYLGFLPRVRSLCLQRDASALLFLEFSSDTAQGILTGKLFEYLVAGPRVLALGLQSDTSVDQVLRETGRGVSLGTDDARIREELTRLLVQQQPSKPVPLDMRNLPPSLARYNRRVQAEQMLGILESLP